MGNVECQNGNANSPPYSPLANDIWSLAILLLNLLTARNPWAKASPSDQTFSAYLHGPANFLPQVLPISQGLNQVLVRALDINWEKRETFGVRGLADGVARLSFDKNEDLTKRQSGLGANYRRKGMGMYASDVVFEGGMARCPWEVGMHIPSGSSGNDDDEIPQHARVEQAQVESRNKAHREKVSTTYNSVENTLVESPRTQSTKAQKHNEVSPFNEVICEYSRSLCFHTKSVRRLRNILGGATTSRLMIRRRYSSHTHRLPLSMSTRCRTFTSPQRRRVDLYPRRHRPHPHLPPHRPDHFTLLLRPLRTPSLATTLVCQKRPHILTLRSRQSITILLRTPPTQRHPLRSLASRVTA